MAGIESVTGTVAAADQLAERFEQDLTEGMDGTSIRAGVIKVASEQRVEPFAELVLAAAARASIATSAPIITHTAARYRTGEQQAPPPGVRGGGRAARTGKQGRTTGRDPQDDRGQPARMAGCVVSPDAYLAGIPDPTQAHSIPIDSPLHGPPPGRFSDGEVLLIQYRSDPDAIAKLVPAPLSPAGDTVMVQIARWGDVPSMGRDTHEANVMVGVRYDGASGHVAGSYSPYFYVDSDRAMAGGREFHGQPKRIADVTLKTAGDLIVGSVRRNGIDVFTGTLPYKALPATLNDMRRRIDFVTNINLKIIPQIDGRPALRQLTARDLADIHVAECWTGPGTARIEPNAQAPLYRLPVIAHLEGYYWRGEFSLVGGVVLHEYDTASGAR